MDALLLAVVLAATVLVVFVLIGWWRSGPAPRCAEDAGPLLLFQPGSGDGAAPAHRQDYGQEYGQLEEGPAPDPGVRDGGEEEPVGYGADVSGPAVVSVPRLRMVTAVADPGSVASFPLPETGNLAPASASEDVPSLDGTLQLLPGRLVPAGGEGSQEIRFVRGRGANRFTLGRAAGSPRAHIQLQAGTVSRLHAWMEYVDGRWSIGNLSATNPLVVNGSSLPVDAALQLDEGDCVELGELAFTFRSR